MINFNKTFSIHSYLTANIKRIFVNEKIYEDYTLISIENSAYHVFGDCLYENPLYLPKLYAALRYVTGPSDMQYDSYKGSFNFTFELDILKNGKSSKYLYSISHYRSYIEFSIEQMISKYNIQDTLIMSQPDDDLFSDKDICEFSLYFCFFLLGYIEGIKHIPELFVKSSESNHLLFGYYRSKYFYKHYESSYQFNKQKTNLERKILNAKNTSLMPQS